MKTLLNHGDAMVPGEELFLRDDSLKERTVGVV